MSINWGDKNNANRIKSLKADIYYHFDKGYPDLSFLDFENEREDLLLNREN